MAFLHGIETFFKERLTSTFTAPLTSVIALIGTAPKGATNVLTSITNRRDAVETFGEQLDGFTIPYALDAIFAQGGANVIVVNIFDDSLHNLAVADEAIVIASEKGSTEFHPQTAVVLTSSDGNTTYELGVDYTLDSFGNIRVLDGTAIADGDTVLASYSHFDATSVTAAQAVGITTGDRSGLELLDNALPLFGYSPKVIIAPEHCENELVAAKMYEKAESFGGIYMVDAPEASTVATVLQGRGALGGIPGFRNSNKSLYPLFPYVRALDSRGNEVTRPLSPYAAGVLSFVDNEYGVQRSPSNQVLQGVLGPTVSYSSSYNDSSSDVNQLNEVGVATVFNTQRRGMVLWGNRNGSAPDNTESDVFLSVERVKRTIIEAMNLNMVKYLDQDLTQGLIDAIRESGNAYLRGLRSQGVIIDGEMLYDTNRNTTETLSQGQLFYTVDFQATTPTERLTITLSFNPDYLSQLA